MEKSTSFSHFIYWQKSIFVLFLGIIAYKNHLCSMWRLWVLFQKINWTFVTLNIGRKPFASFKKMMIMIESSVSLWFCFLFTVSCFIIMHCSVVISTRISKSNQLVKCVMIYIEQGSTRANAICFHRNTSNKF